MHPYGKEMKSNMQMHKNMCKEGWPQSRSAMTNRTSTPFTSNLIILALR